MGEAVRDVGGPDAIKFASMKASSISEDARRVLDICRSVHSSFVSTGSWKPVNSCRRTVELIHTTQKTTRVGGEEGHPGFRTARRPHTSGIAASMSG